MQLELNCSRCNILRRSVRTKDVFSAWRFHHPPKAKKVLLIQSPKVGSRNFGFNLQTTNATNVQKWMHAGCIIAGLKNACCCFFYQLTTSRPYPSRLLRLSSRLGARALRPECQRPKHGGSALEVSEESTSAWRWIEVVQFLFIISGRTSDDIKWPGGICQFFHQWSHHDDDWSRSAHVYTVFIIQGASGDQPDAQALWKLGVPTCKTISGDRSFAVPFHVKFDTWIHKYIIHMNRYQSNTGNGAFVQSMCSISSTAILECRNNGLLNGVLEEYQLVKHIQQNYGCSLI